MQRQDACFRSVSTLDVDDIEAIYETCRRHAVASKIEAMEQTYADIAGRSWVPVKLEVDGIPLDDVRRLRTLGRTSFASLHVRTFGRTVWLSCHAAGCALVVDDEEPLVSRTFTDVSRILLRRRNRFVGLAHSEWFVPAVVLTSPVALSTAAQYYAEPVLDLVGVSVAVGVLVLWLWWEHGVWGRRPMVVIGRGRADRTSAVEQP